MMNQGVYVEYGNIAPGAKEDFVPSVNNEAFFSNLSQLSKYNLSFTNESNPCELYSVLLDGQNQLLKDDYTKSNIGYVSEYVTDAQGNFESEIVFDFIADETYSADGLTFDFGDDGIFPPVVDIEWYRSGDLIAQETANVSDDVFVIYKRVEEFDEIKIRISKLNMPHNRLRLQSMDYGYGTVFKGSELKSINIIQEYSPISAELPINVVDLTIYAASGKYSFAEKQQIKVYFDGKLKQSTFIKDFEEVGKNSWRIECEDWIGLLDDISFDGRFCEEEAVGEIFEEIFDKNNVRYVVDDENILDMKVSGLLPNKSCRVALQNIAFVCGFNIDTTESDELIIKQMSDENTQFIEKKRIKEGIKLQDEEFVTSVGLYHHKYVADSEYRADSSGVYAEEYIDKVIDKKNDIAYNIESEYEYNFDKPVMVHFVRAENAKVTEITTPFKSKLIAIGTRQNRVGSFIYTVTYFNTISTEVTKENPIKLKSNIKKKVEIKEATLVNENNVNELLERIFPYIINNKSVDAEIVEGKHVVYGGYDEDGNKLPDIITYDEPVHLGDVITVETDYQGIYTGRIIRQQYGLNGSILFKDVTIK